MNPIQLLSVIIDTSTFKPYSNIAVLTEALNLPNNIDSWSFGEKNMFEYGTVEQLFCRGEETTFFFYTFEITYLKQSPLFSEEGIDYRVNNLCGSGDNYKYVVINSEIDEARTGADPETADQITNVIKKIKQNLQPEDVTDYSEIIAIADPDFLEYNETVVTQPNIADQLANLSNESTPESIADQLSNLEKPDANSILDQLSALGQEIQPYDDEQEDNSLETLQSIAEVLAPPDPNSQVCEVIQVPSDNELFSQYTRYTAKVEEFNYYETTLSGLIQKVLVFNQELSNIEPVVSYVTGTDIFQVSYTSDEGTFIYTVEGSKVG